MLVVFVSVSLDGWKLDLPLHTHSYHVVPGSLANVNDGSFGNGMTMMMAGVWQKCLEVGGQESCVEIGKPYKLFLCDRFTYFPLTFKANLMSQTPLGEAE